MTIRKRLAYATRGFRGGENVTQTLYINEDVSLEFTPFEVTVEKIEDAILSVDISPYQEFSVEVSSLADDITVDLEVLSEAVTIEHISNEVTIEPIEPIDDISISL